MKQIEVEKSKVTEEVFDAYIKQFKPEMEYSDATAIVEMVLRSDLVQNLLYYFWQSSSDACPLEVSESEKQEQAFKDFIKQTFNT